jgi:hypothetical protein
LYLRNPDSLQILSLSFIPEHDEHIGAGSVEICRATFILDARKKGEKKEKLVSVEGKLDTCGSVSLSHSSHLQQVRDCRKYGLKEVVLSGIGGKSKPLRYAGVQHVKTSMGEEKKILCCRYDERVGNTEQILLLSLRTIRDANIDILHHMDQSLDGISSPLLFLQDKDARVNKKKGTTGKARASEKFLRQQRRKRDRGNACAVLLASNTTAARERDTRSHNEGKGFCGADPHLSFATDCPRYEREGNGRGNRSEG